MGKKKIISIFGAVFGAALLITATGVFGADNTVSKTKEMSCFKDEDMGEAYDTSVFYRNDLYVIGGDADVIWVSEEQGGPEYGGYFYMYTSGNDFVDLENYGSYKSVITCLRSRDMNDWELCGQNGGADGIVNGSEGTDITAGFCVWVGQDEWIKSHVWAPEVIYNQNDGKYYMYTSASKTGPIKGQNLFDSFYGAVLISDTPVGPFKLATSERYYGDATKANLNGRVITGTEPQIDVVQEGNLDGIFATIDLSPFMDDSGDLYLYFVRHVDSNNHNHNCIWGVKMKDMITPDYSTMRKLLACDYKTVTYRNLFNYSNLNERNYKETDYFADAGGIIEGPQMVKHEGRYYLCYSPRGWGNKDYDTMQSISDSPLGPFTKVLCDNDGNGADDGLGKVMGRRLNEDEMTGTGHAAFVEVEGEMFCTYFVHADPLYPDDKYNATAAGSFDGRIYAFDRVEFIDVPNYGTLLYGNGPTKSLQPKPFAASGVRNIAQDATVTVINATDDTTKYVNDGIFVCDEGFADRELRVDGATTIKLSFDEPRTIRGVMVYNSLYYANAFSKVDKIEFDLAEKPSSYIGDDGIEQAYIEDIPFNMNYVRQDEKLMRPGGAAVTSFDEITVNSITITISKKFDTAQKEIRISDIVILGN